MREIEAVLMEGRRKRDKVKRQRYRGKNNGRGRKKVQSYEEKKYRYHDKTRKS